MKITYGTLPEYTYYMNNCQYLLHRHDLQDKIAQMHKIQQEIMSMGALDPANPQTRTIIGPDLYDPATQNGVLFYPEDVKYIHDTIHTDTIYKILPQNPHIAISSGDYMVKKLIINYEYFLDNTNPPTGTKRALICLIGEIMDFMNCNDASFRKQLAADRFFIQRWFEKIR